MAKSRNPEEDLITFGAGTIYLLSQYIRGTPKSREKKAISASLKRIEQQAREFQDSLSGNIANSYRQFADIVSEAAERIGNASKKNVSLLNQDYISRISSKINYLTCDYRAKRKLPSIC